MIRYIWILVLLLGLSGCRSTESTHAVNFYYWKSTFQLGTVEKHYLSQLKTDVLYVRLFDVDKGSDGAARPLGTLSGLDTTGLDQRLVPVVFITNRTFLQISSNAIDTLALRVYNRVQRMFERAHLPAPREIQIDCDWTAGTREAYFQFLECMKKQGGQSITTTLRLHQVKFKEETGIPPVDKVYLMCYATSSPLEKDSKNSILDMPLLEHYLETLNTYPVPFDIALPLYSWAIVRNHLGEVRLINGVTEADLSPAYYHRQSNGLYLVKEDVFLNGMYLNAGFQLEVEHISPALLRKLKAFLKEHVQGSYNLLYFHLDAEFLQRFAITELKH